MWTTMRNLKMWFEKWKVDLMDISFTEEDEDRNVSIKNYKPKDICNLDKTCISLDGSNRNKGGRLEAVLFDTRFPLQ